MSLTAIGAAIAAFTGIGAGIGIGSAELTWWLSDLCFGKGSNVAQEDVRVGRLELGAQFGIETSVLNIVSVEESTADAVDDVSVFLVFLVDGSYLLGHVGCTRADDLLHGLYGLLAFLCGNGSADAEHQGSEKYIFELFHNRDCCFVEQ